MLLGNLLNDQRAGRFAVQQHGQVKFLFNLRAGGEQQRLHLPAFRASLLGDQHLAQHMPGERNRFIHGRRDPDAALKTVFERALAAAARVDLRFDDNLGVAGGHDLLRRRAHFGERLGGNFKGNGDAVFGEQLLGLIFVDVHLEISQVIKADSTQKSNILVHIRNTVPHRIHQNKSVNSSGVSRTSGCRIF